MSDVVAKGMNLESKDDSRAIYKFVKSFIIGYSLPVIPSLISLLIKRVRALFNNEIVKEHVASSIWKIISSSSFFRFGLSFGVMGGGYALLFSRFEKLLGNKLISSFFAGFISGFGILFDNSYSGRDRRLILALYVFVRGLEMIYQSLVVNGYVRKIEHLDTILFTTSCFEIMTSWVYHPYSLPKSYSRWISNMAEISPSLLEMAKLQKDGGWRVGLSTDVFAKYATQLGYPTADGNPINGFVGCKFVHPYSPHSCTVGNVHVWTNSFKKAFLLYAPVHLIPLLIWKRKLLIAKPFESLMWGALDVFRSSAFLSSFVAIIYAQICFWRNFLQEDTLVGPMMGAATCGLSVLLEKKSRRMELALYCLPRALHCTFEKCFAYLRLNATTTMDYKVKIGTLLFAIGLGMITCTMECEPHVQGAFIRNLLLWFFGNAQ